MVVTDTVARDTVVLAVNFGSSSLKTALYAGCGESRRRLVRARIARLSDGRLSLDWDGGSAEETVGGDPLLGITDALAAHGFPLPTAVGHRFVHGGNFDGPRVLDDAVLDRLRGLTGWAPQHQPAALAGVEQIGEAWPDVVQVGCFDTAFHRTMPEVAQRLPLPPELWDAGVRRYGFHGLSYEHVVAAVGVTELGRAVIAHLGNGSSMCAVDGGRSVDTTMAFTPDAGLFMGSRSGDVDPGLLLHLLTRADDPLDAEQLRQLLQERSGLRGLSATKEADGDSDMQALLERSDPAAGLAVDAYCRQVAKQVGAYASVLGGVDTLVFTGGIGEHAAAVRDGVVERLGFLSIGRVRVVPADEEAVIAAQTAGLAGAR